MTDSDPHPDPRPVQEAGDEVRRARVEDLPRLAHVLALAFEDDPLFAWVFRDPADRLRRAERMFRLISVPESLRHDESRLTTDHAGVALWVPPGKGRTGLAEAVRLLPTAARALGRDTPRALRVMTFLESKVPPEPHAHLMFLGTHPARQGEGVGSRLLRHTLENLDRAGTPAYLDATTLRSRALYLRHGFTDLDQVHLPGGGPCVWRMWRSPLPVGAA